MAKSPDEMASAMVANLPEKTGKSLEQWLAIVRASGLAKHGQIVALIKGEHGVTHGYASLIAHHALGAGFLDPGAGEEQVAAQFAGDKAALKPIYDALIAAAKKLGRDVEVAPRKTYVTLRRNKQFAVVKAATRTRVDLGLNLKGEKPGGRLELSGPLGAMVTHRIVLTKKSEVDAEVKALLKQAYERS